MSEPDEILREIQQAPADARDRLRGEESAECLVSALGLASDERARMILCDVLGDRHEQAAVEALIVGLDDPCPGVRDSAADALAKIKDARAGAALMRRLALPEPEPGVRRMLVVALGAVGHREAIPSLMALLRDDDPSMRGGAAWSLGALRAREALPELQRALRREHAPYALARMEEAIGALRPGAERA